MRNLSDGVFVGEKEDFGVPTFQAKVKVSLLMKRDRKGHRWGR